MTNDMPIKRPAIVEPGVTILSFRNERDLDLAMQAILNNQEVLIEGPYHLGLALLHELQVELKKTYPNRSYQEQRQYRSAFRKHSHLILIAIKNHQLAAKKSPEIGWLKKLYPEISDFVLPFSDVQGLNSAWQWYTKGISIPVLRNKLHPYYGTYFPTRFEHLILFDNWLKRYDGDKKTAIDVGIGSGVLAFQMLKHGFQKVFGTDTNPNAIIGLRELMGDTKLSRKIELDYGHLFGKWIKPAELIVFNPPWLPASHDLDSIDLAIFYDENLFSDFFAEAKKRLLPNGKLVLLFSNLGQITNTAPIHPIEKEITEGGRFQLDICLKKAVKAASEKTNRDQYWRSSEQVELWVLKHL